MKCAEAKGLIEAYVDGELDVVRTVEFESHTAGCPECAALAKASALRRQSIRVSIGTFKAPASLRAKTIAALRTEGMTAGSPVDSVRTGGLRLWPYAGMLAASVALALLAGFGLGTVRAQKNAVLEEALSAHLRSLQPGHLMDVVSTDQHTVKPWFAGKLDFSPPVVDLADIGFPLAGGRLDRVAGRPAAALVFRRKLHEINVFVWPSGSNDPSAAASRENGYNRIVWSDSGFGFAAVSDISEQDLSGFVSEFRRRTRAPAEP
jgi:anti-sigma factor RsiW